MAKDNSTLTQYRLKELLDYNPETGAFTSKINRPKGPNPWVIGQAVIPKARTIIIDGNSYNLSHLAWFYCYGVWPKTKIVFISGNSNDLSIANLTERSSDSDLTVKRLKSLLLYNPDTGLFTRKIRTSNRIKAGDVAGCLHKNGYWHIKIDGFQHKAHRLAWLYCYGSFPEGEIDHMNGDPSDNRIANLRDVSHAHNVQNLRKPRRDNRSGFLGVHKCHQGWVARISVAKQAIRLGVFKSPEEAHAAYLAAKRKHHIACTI